MTFVQSWGYLLTLVPRIKWIRGRSDFVRNVVIAATKGYAHGTNMNCGWVISRVVMRQCCNHMSIVHTLQASSLCCVVLFVCCWLGVLY